MHLDTLEMPATLRALPSPASAPLNAIEPLEHLHSTQSTSLLQKQNTATYTKEPLRPQSSHLPFKPFYMFWMPSNRPQGGLRRSAPTPLPSHGWTWTTTPFAFNPCLASSTLPTRKTPTTQSGTLSDPPAFALICGGTPSGHPGGALLSWRSLPLTCLFQACPHKTQKHPKATSCKLPHYSLGGIATAISHLSSINNITSDYATTTPKFIPTPDGSFVISHLRKDTSSQLTNFVVSMANPHTYAMISTMDTPVKVRLPTTITIAGSHHQQIVHIQLNPHNRSIIGRTYAGLFQNPLTQSMNTSDPIPKVHQTK